MAAAIGILGTLASTGAGIYSSLEGNKVKNTSISTMNPLQRKYMWDYTQQLAPHVGKQISTLADLGKNRYDTYNMIPSWQQDFNQKVAIPERTGRISALQKLVDPTSDQATASLNNRFRTMRREDMGMIKQNVRDKERALQQIADESAYDKQQSALGQMAGMFAGPLGYQSTTTQIQQNPDAMSRIGVGLQTYGAMKQSFDNINNVGVNAGAWGK